MTQDTPVDENTLAVPRPAHPAVKPGFKEAVTLAHEHLSGTFHYFTFHTDTPLFFKPGQYVSVRVAQTRVNCYSIAGSDDDKTFHLFVNTAHGGPGSQFFEKLTVGDTMTYLGPLGIFGLHLDDGSRSLVFGATGSGIAPLICMIQDVLVVQKLQIPVHLYIGLTFPHEVFWRERFSALSTQFPHFSSTIVVLNPDDTWTGPTGFITHAIAQDYPDAGNVSAYLCGHPQMIADVSSVLVEHGCNSKCVYTEKY